MIDKYIGIPYDLFNQDGVNCWALVALVYKDLFGEKLKDFKAERNTFGSISAAFTAAFASGEHGFSRIDNPVDFCVIVMKNKRLQHCGIWYKGNVLHAMSASKQVIYQTEKQATKLFNEVEYWRYD